MTQDLLNLLSLRVTFRAMRSSGYNSFVSSDVTVIFEDSAQRSESDHKARLVNSIS